MFNLLIQNVEEVGAEKELKGKKNEKGKGITKTKEKGKEKKKKKRTEIVLFVVRVIKVTERKGEKKSLSLCCILLLWSITCAKCSDK